MKIWLSLLKKTPKLNQPTNQQTKNQNRTPPLLMTSNILALVLTFVLFKVTYTHWSACGLLRTEELRSGVQESEWRLFQVSDLIKFYPRLFW